MPSSFLVPLTELVAESGGLSVIGYTSGKPIQATQHEYDFDRDRLLLGIYCAPPEDNGGAALAKQAGIDFFISYSVGENQLDACADNGIGVIAGGYSLPRYYSNHFDESTIAEWYNFNGTTGYKNHPPIWGDDIFDEPDSNEFPLLVEAINNYYDKTVEKRFAV